MPPLTGKLLADFSDFYDAVRQAEVELKGMETGAANVEKSLNRMVDSLSGRKVVQDATLMAEAVQRIGGVSQLTAAELQRVGRAAEEAVAKLQALGKEIPADLERLAAAARSARTSMEAFSAQTVAANVTALSTATQGATSSFSKMQTGLSQVDRTLGALGVEMGHGITAVKDLAIAYQLANTAVGGLTRTIGVVGVALAAIDIAKLVFTHREAIAEWVKAHHANLMGLGAVYRETKAAADEMQQRIKESVGDAKQLATYIADINKELDARDRDRARDQAKDFAENFRRAAAERAALAKKAADEKKAADDKEKADMAAAETAWRAYENFMSQRALENEGARMAQEAAEYAAMLAQKKAAYDAWWKSVNQGVLSTGADKNAGLLFSAPGVAITGGASSLERPQSLNQRGVYLGEGVSTYTPALPAAGPPVTINNNFNGLLLSSDPSAKQQFSSWAQGTFMDSLANSRKVTNS